MTPEFKILLTLLALDGMRHRPDVGCPASSSEHSELSNRVFYSKLGGKWYIIPCERHLQFYIDHHREIKL